MAKKKIHIPTVEEILDILAAHQGYIFIGIDPGSKSGIGALMPDGQCWAWKAPMVKTPRADADIPGTVALLAPFAHKDVRLRVRVMLEKTASRPTDTAMTAFSMGRYRMLWEALLTAAGIPWDFVAPSTWKSKMGLSSEKDDSLRMARRLFPSIELPNKSDHDKAEGLLLAEYMRRHHFGSQKK